MRVRCSFIAVCLAVFSKLHIGRFVKVSGFAKGRKMAPQGCFPDSGAPGILRPLANPETLKNCLCAILKNLPMCVSKIVWKHTPNTKNKSSGAIGTIYGFIILNGPHELVYASQLRPAISLPPCSQLAELHLVKQTCGAPEAVIRSCDLKQVIQCLSTSAGHRPATDQQMPLGLLDAPWAHLEPFGLIWTHLGQLDLLKFQKCMFF